MNSILFAFPDYHCSFILRDEFRRIGWKADVYIPPIYADPNLIYSTDAIIDNNLQDHIKRYDNIFVYANPDIGRHPDKNMIFVPNGCLEEELKANFSKLNGGKLCANCGHGPEVCNDEYNANRFRLIRENFNSVISRGYLVSSQYLSTPCRYKSLDLSIWKDDIDIPEEHKMGESKKVRVLHSFFDKNRGKNAKGSWMIYAAIMQIEKEGYPVEYLNIRDRSIADMRYYQAQADIIVDQLYYGWWGSTGIEAMALGKPLVCYLLPEFKERFMRTFGYSSLPVVEADENTIYTVLRQLVASREDRTQIGIQSRDFALRHYDAQKNVPHLIKTLNLA